MKNIIPGILSFITSIGFSQDLVNELNGFKLNQFREAPTSEFKKPLQKKTFDDGFELELFLIKPDSTAYMVFEYANWDKNIIWSIQLYGDDQNLKPNFESTPKRCIFFKYKAEVNFNPQSRHFLGMRT